MRNPFGRFHLALAMGVVAFACDQSNAVPEFPFDAGEASQVIGPSGGTVTADDGTTVQIPAGALNQDVTITIAPNALAPELNVGQALAVAHLFGPEGQTFLQPVSITMPYDSSRMPPGTMPKQIIVYSAAAGTNLWTRLPTTVVDSSHVVATTSDFCNMQVSVQSPDQVLLNEPR